MNTQNKYKTELHCHSVDVSNCADASVEYIVERYVEAGYTTLILANHFSRHTFGGNKGKYTRFLEENGLDDSWSSKVRFFLNGYHLLQNAAVGKLNVILGMEYQPFDGTDNDYLVYGLTEELLETSECIMSFSIGEMSEYLHSHGLLLYQAHPFRNGMTVKNPKYFDGYEVYNGHIFHDSRNRIANEWADLHEKKKISGTDFHESRHIPCGGILTDLPITSTEQLLITLKSEEYELIKDVKKLI